MVLSERIWAMDVKFPRVVAATADKKIHMYNLTNGGAVYRVMASPLQHQVRVVRIFHSAQGCFCIGTIEGRVAVRYIEERTDAELMPGGAADKLKNSFSFRCHRQATSIYPVNCIDTHPYADFQDVFATAGSDGTLVFWNKAKKLKLKEHTQFLLCVRRAAPRRSAAAGACVAALSNPRPHPRPHSLRSPRRAGSTPSPPWRSTRRARTAPTPPRTTTTAASTAWPARRRRSSSCTRSRRRTCRASPRPEAARAAAPSTLAHTSLASSALARTRVYRFTRARSA
jgi:WD40 repeat protein